jgi:hypothetical protein
MDVDCRSVPYLPYGPPFRSRTRLRGAIFKNQAKIDNNNNNNHWHKTNKAKRNETKRSNTFGHRRDREAAAVRFATSRASTARLTLRRLRAQQMTLRRLQSLHASLSRVATRERERERERARAISTYSSTCAVISHWIRGMNGRRGRACRNYM